MSQESIGCFSSKALVYNCFVPYSTACYDPIVNTFHTFLLLHREARAWTSAPARSWQCICLEGLWAWSCLHVRYLFHTVLFEPYNWLSVYHVIRCLRFRPNLSAIKASFPRAVTCPKRFRRDKTCRFYVVPISENVVNRPTGWQCRWSNSYCFFPGATFHWTSVWQHRRRHFRCSGLWT